MRKLLCLAKGRLFAARLPLQYMLCTDLQTLGKQIRRQSRTLARPGK